MKLNSFKNASQKLAGILLLAVLFLNSNISKGQNSTVNIADFGADRTGNENCAGIINQLIDSLASNSGGTVFIPSGTYSCGPIFMKSNITLLTDNGAIINFIDDFDAYLPMVTSQWEGVRVKTFASQIYAIDASNIAIKGQGHFEGHGKKWWDFWYKVSREKVTETKWQELFINENKDLLERNDYIPKMHNFLRPAMVMFYNCNRITIEGVSFSNPPFWTIVPTYCENVTIHNITINNPGDSPNTDGIDPCSCRNVRISDCHITVGDDCIVLKSGRDIDGREAAMPTENITITNCTMLNGHGGVVLGSEMSGDIRRVTISNCVFEGTDRGIRIKSMRGRGGIIEDVRVSNIVMRDIVREGIMINMRYHETPVEELSERTPLYRNIHFSNINITDAKHGIAIYGLEERSVEQVSFTDMFIQTEKGIWAHYANNVIFDNIRLITPSLSPIHLDKCNNIVLKGIQLHDSQEGTSVIEIDNCQQVKISDCFQIQPVETFLKYKQCEKIYLTNNILPGVKKVLMGDKPKSIYQFNNIQ